MLKIAKEEGLNADAMSPGEIYVEELAGFKPEDILYISNNVSADEMQFAIDRGITISVDSLSQLEMYGKLNPGGKICIRFNPGLVQDITKKSLPAVKNKLVVAIEDIPVAKNS